MNELEHHTIDTNGIRMHIVAKGDGTTEIQNVVISRTLQKLYT